MSKAPKPARLDVADDSFFASKGEPPPAATQSAPARAPVPVEVPSPAPDVKAQGPAKSAARGGKKEDQQPVEKAAPIATTIAFPPEIMQRIQARLQQEQQHNLRTLVFYALSKIGIEIEPEYLKPTRRRWTR